MYDAEGLIEQNRQLMQEVKRRIDQLGAINTVAAAVGQSLDLDRTLETALRAVLEVVGAEAGGISLIDETTKEVVLRAQRGWIRDINVAPMRIPPNQGMSGQVIRTNNMVVYNDLDGTEEYAVPSFKEEHFRSIAMAPMRARGKIIGILSIMSHTPDQFTEEILNVLRAVADTVGVAVDNARLYETRVEQEKRLNAILHSTADGIIATDQSGLIRLVNYTAEAILDINAADLIGTPLREANIQPRIRKLLLDALTSPMQEDSKTFQVNLESGTVLSAMVSPIYVESQVEQRTETDGWVIVLQDVTHLREAEITRAQFIQAAAHDMRNPLSVTQSSLNLLRDIIVSDDKDVHEVIHIALNSVDRLQALIDDLLHLEHIESGYGFNLTDVNLIEFLQEVCAEIKPLMDNKQLDFKLDIQTTIPVVYLDRRWISRALHNYLSNAYKYTPAGSKILLRTFVKEETIHLEVIDNGPGIPASAHARLFERFYRVKGTEEISGTGLGLAIVKSVAVAHNGSVYLQSKEGAGSTFGLKLPLKPLE